MVSLLRVLGEEGKRLMMETVLREELETAMRLVGITDLSQAHEGLVNALDLEHLVPKEAEDGPVKAKM